MKTVFAIQPEAIFFDQTILIFEISSNGLSYVFLNDIDRKFLGLSVFSFDKEDGNVTDALKKICKEESLLQKKYKKVLVAYSFAESALLPEKFYTGSHETLLNTLYGDLEKGIILTDMIGEKNMYNVYRVSGDVHYAIISQFPLATFTHQYTLLAKKMMNEKDLLHVIFYHDKFVVILAKSGQLKIIQTYTYYSATDVIYYLLAICKQFNVENISLQLGGMIKESDELFAEISRYFSNVSFDKLQEEYTFSEKIKDLPAHYFSHLFYSALCV